MYEDTAEIEMISVYCEKMLKFKEFHNNFLYYMEY